MLKSKKRDWLNKMKVFVLGNINSGKSFLLEKLSLLLPQYKILKIDDYRKEHCDFSIEKEELVWKNFPKLVMEYEDVVVEMSGGGVVSENMLNLLEDNSFIVLKLNTSVEVCLNRLKDKDFDKIPYPKYSETIEDTIKRIDKDFQGAAIEKKWGKALKIYTINSDTIINDLPILQYHFMFKVKNVLGRIKSSLFLFGSSGRGKMSNLSDVDMYLLTNESIVAVEKTVKSAFANVRLMANEFVIHDGNVLIELNYINKISDSKLFYNRSLIDNPSKTILKDDYNVLPSLVEYSKMEFDKQAELNYTIERLLYFCESLPRLIEKDDEYKYYFHNNIVIHEYVKLKAFLQGIYDYSYLPLHAKKYLSNDEWQKILYRFGDDRHQHYIIVLEMAKEIISLVEKQNKS